MLLRNEFWNSMVLNLAAIIGIEDLSELVTLDVTVDGTDEIDPFFRLIKGGGGALLREKIVASSSQRMLVIADGSKRVDTLGRFRLPVEMGRRD